jgi:hypothetical protein
MVRPTASVIDVPVQRILIAKQGALERQCPEWQVSVDRWVVLLGRGCSTVQLNVATCLTDGSLTRNEVGHHKRV